MCICSTLASFICIDGRVMSPYAFEYVVVGVLGLLSIFSFVIGQEQMIKLVLSNYIISIACLFFSHSLSVAIVFLQEQEAGSFLGIRYDKRLYFVESGQTTLVLILFGVLLITVFLHSHVEITLPDDRLWGSIFSVLLIPLTVFSVLFTLQIAVFGDSIVRIEQLRALADSLTSQPWLAQVFILTPVWMTLHALMTLRLTTRIGVQYRRSSLPTPGLDA